MMGTTSANSKARPILLLGASGFFGPALLDAFGDFSTIATHFDHAGAGSLHFDASRTRIAELVGDLAVRPVAAVVLFGVTNIDQCARDPAGTGHVNVAGAIRVIEELRALGIKPVYVSSDAVFDGTHSFYKEDDATQPILEYGRQKQVVERFLASLPPPWIVVRLPKLLATSRGTGGMLNEWIAGLGRNERILCATDQFFTPAAASDAAQAIAMLVSSGAQGVFHLGGPERLSRRTLLAELVDEYRKYESPRAQIEDCFLREIPVFEPRPLDTSLDSSRFAAYCQWNFLPASMVARMAVRWYFSGASHP
jgi:dTDP-4-dehydrorhamnose reductase